MKRKIPKIINQQFKMDGGTNGINIGALQNVVYGAVPMPGTCTPFSLTSQ